MFGFKKKIKSVELVSPVNGKMICLKDVPDKVFASEMMGPGVAFISSDGKVYSPCDGELVTVFPTKHALGIKTNKELNFYFILVWIQLIWKVRVLLYIQRLVEESNREIYYWKWILNLFKIRDIRLICQ